MADKLSLDSASARPWFVVEPPFNEGAPWINAGSPDPHGGEFVCDLAWPHEFETPENVARTEANAELIVQAVNEHAALAALEVGLREAFDSGRPLNSPIVQATLRSHLAAIEEVRRG